MANLTTRSLQFSLRKISASATHAMPICFSKLLSSWGQSHLYSAMMLPVVISTLSNGHMEMQADNPSSDFVYPVSLQSEGRAQKFVVQDVRMRKWFARDNRVRNNGSRLYKVLSGGITIYHRVSSGWGNICASLQCLYSLRRHCLTSSIRIPFISLRLPWVHNEDCYTCLTASLFQ